MEEATISTASVRQALTGTVQRVGRLQKVLASDTNAACADLRITLTGGMAGVRAQVEFVVSLNTSVGSGRTAQLIDETAASPPVQARKSSNRYVFGPVHFVEPGPSQFRVFRITNVRIDGTVLATGGGGGATPVQAQASVSISSVLLSNSKQAVASVSVLRT
jgi:hypothetical protein